MSSVSPVSPEADRVGLDLSTWELAYCGAEPIKPDTLKAFVNRFQPVGFSPEALSPCYGLAEATLMVCSVPKHEAPLVVAFDTLALSQGIARHSLPGDRACDLVACGPADSGQRVMIVDAAQSQRLDQGRLGEIWVQGKGIADGYYRLPEERVRFHATLPEVPGGWLRTGDLGFIFEGQLFVIGRSHDQLVIHGRILCSMISNGVSPTSIRASAVCCLCQRKNRSVGGDSGTGGSPCI